MTDLEADSEADEADKADKADLNRTESVQSAL